VGAGILTAAIGLAGTVIAAAGQASQAVREFTVVAERYKFTPARLEVRQGEKVRVTIRSADSSHGFEIKKLKVDEYVPKGGRPVTVEFVATEAGEFPIECSEYCGKGHENMKGVLVVRPR
jgi:cytochrome c oxidase subunit 2